MNPNNTKHLFLFTLGPVQSFIEQARKTQDLFAGSRILSTLIKTGMEEFDFNNQIIFPKSKGVSIPNRFIAHFEGSTETAQQKGEEVTTIVQQKFKTLGQKAIDNANIDFTEQSLDFQQAFFQQLKQHLDIYWGFVPLANDYKTSYQKLENLLSSLKNARTFEQFSYHQLGEQGRKCSLDGERNALFYKPRQVYGRAKKPAFLKTGVRINRHELLVGEGLSAISFTKRFQVFKNENNKKVNFPSTAEVSLLHDISFIPSPVLKYLKEYKLLFSGIKGFISWCLDESKRGGISIKMNNENKDIRTDFDYQLIFEENLVEKYVPNIAQLDAAKIVQRKLKKHFTTRYYALLKFDGDKMGEKLGKLATKDFHPQFSKLIAEFAEKASNCIDSNNYGRTIYAGGDDFLGFINIFHLFTALTALQHLFNRIINQNENLKIHGVDAFTFSAGIVIAHYKTPLSEVLKKARKVEKIAKEAANRNAFCITALRHSGEIQQAVFKWGEALENWKALETIVQNVTTKEGKEANFSTKFINNLTIELQHLGGMKGNFSHDGIIETEVKRLLDRAILSGNQEDKQQLQQAILLLWDAYNEGNLGASEQINRTENFIHALQIADFISRKTSSK